jgi:hypothetical protein
MPRISPHRSRPGAIGLTIALCLLGAAAQEGLASASSPTCAERVQAVRRRSLAKVLRCNVRAKCHGGVTSASCLARARSALSRLSGGEAACAVDVPSLTSAVEACTTAVLAQIPEDGRCAARKLMAVRASLRTNHRRNLCRAFARAGDCAGDCLAIADTLTTCLRDNPQPPPQQTLPPVGPDDRIILFGSYEGDAISTVTVAGQDEDTETARVVIAPGTAPLYVVLPSYEQIIWRFEGDVSRVSHVVLAGYGPSGVTGIAADRVADVSQTDGSSFGDFYETASDEARQTRTAVETALGRPVDVFAGSYSVGTLTLPAATVEESTPAATVPPGFDPAVYQLGLWFNPGGVVSIDPMAVVSTAPAEPYEVLPQGFGLAQLVASGALEARDGYFYIARAIPRFPAGLYGAHSVSFVLGRGVPMPPGSPGHSCVISEETGLPLSDAVLCGIYPPPSHACTFPTASPDAQVVLFGAYEGDAVPTVTVNGPNEDGVTARVVIESGSTPLYIILATYEQMIWRFEGDTARIERVVLLGYGAQGLTGVSPARVTILTDAASNTCFRYFYDPQSPEGVAAHGATGTALGRPVDVFAGSYSVGTVALPSATTTASATPPGIPPEFDPSVYEREGLWFNPGGVVAIDPSLVVAIGSPEVYDVLPQGFGLAQLVATGGLEVLDGVSFPITFRIARPIPRFPAGLYGAQLVRFVLGRGVPMPAGTPGHSCVISEETGQPIANESICDIFGD